jgi:hypothetical protein
VRARVTRPSPGARSSKGILLVLALAGCGEDVEQPPSGAHRLEDEVALGTSSQTWLIVVDSSATSAADELRRLYAEEFVTYWADATRLCADDAAAWAPARLPRSRTRLRCWPASVIPSPAARLA